MIGRRAVLALGAAVLMAATFAGTPARAGQDILIGGGSVTGVYYQFAQQAQQRQI